MKRMIFAIFAMVFIARQAFALECSPLNDMLKNMLAERQLAYLATSITNQGNVLMYFVNRQGEWVMIGVDNDLKACILLEGQDWTFAIEGGA